MTKAASTQSPGPLVVLSGSPTQVRQLCAFEPTSRALAEHSVEVLREALELRPEAIELVCSLDPRWRTEVEGSFQAWGAPTARVSTGFYLTELVGRWLLEATGVPLPPIEVSDSLHLRPGCLSVVVLDGSAGLSDRAPLSLLPEAPRAHQWCTDLLSGCAVPPADTETLRAGGIQEPALWTALYQARQQHDWRCELHRADATLGVGRYLATWELP